MVRGRFKLSRVQVTEGKITVNKYARKSMENQFWFEIARVRVIGSRLYFVLFSFHLCCLLSLKLNTFS